MVERGPSDDAVPPGSALPVIRTDGLRPAATKGPFACQASATPDIDFGGSKSLPRALESALGTPRIRGMLNIRGRGPHLSARSAMPRPQAASRGERILLHADSRTHTIRYFAAKASSSDPEFRPAVPEVQQPSAIFGPSLRRRELTAIGDCRNLPGSQLVFPPVVCNNCSPVDDLYKTNHLRRSNLHHIRQSGHRTGPRKWPSCGIPLRPQICQFINFSSARLTQLVPA